MKHERFASDEEHDDGDAEEQADLLRRLTLEFEKQSDRTMRASVTKISDTDYVVALAARSGLRIRLWHSFSIYIHL